MVDTTNGYVMDKLEIDAVPLPTGSFTGLAMLSPGVNAELSGGTGANAGLGNAPVWANGQRDTSNTFLLNGVDARSLFNGKSTSQVDSARVVNNTGISGASSSQRNSGAEQRIRLSRDRRVDSFARAGIHPGSSREYFDVRRPTRLDQRRAHRHEHRFRHKQYSRNCYVHHGTNWLNADPFFYNADPNIPDERKESRTAPIHGGRRDRPADHEEQTLLLRQLPIHSRIGRRNWYLAGIRAARTYQGSLAAGLATAANN